MLYVHCNPTVHSVKSVNDLTTFKRVDNMSVLSIMFAYALTPTKIIKNFGRQGS